jgi:hypothetical protein
MSVMFKKNYDELIFKIKINLFFCLSTKELNNKYFLITSCCFNDIDKDNNNENCKHK